MSNSLDFRAPPPSPVGPGRRSTVANDDILTDFLHQTLIVPDLVLPDRVFPRQNPNIQSLPKLDFKKLSFSDDFKLEDVIEVIAQTGCFELVNHGISRKLFRDVKECGKRVFGLEDEKKRVILRSNERLYGFVEVNGDDKDLIKSMSNSLDFRAPPPSPVGPGRRSTVANDDILTDFLHQTLIVPDLVLPDRVFPRQNPNIQSLPKLDFKKLSFSDDFKLEDVIEVIAQTGCFELVNHGISRKLFRDVKECGKRVFGLEDEKKRVILRSNERLYGFVEVNGDDKDVSEEFVWCRDESLRSEMEGVWMSYTDFSEKMENLMSKIENISESLLKLFLDPYTPKSRVDEESTRDKETMGSMCYLYKHSKNTDNLSNDDEYMDSLSYDVIRMLIRGSEHKHTLCFHVCDGSSEFHVYSKKGWVSFSPDKNALVVTIGDQLQTWSEGKYKHVIGRPIFKGELEDCISMAFLYSPPISKGQEDKTISLVNQILLALFLTFIYNLFSYIST
ncbi:hypothetical protein CTI12_AA214440 [Artemisia annua]|uniref:Non-heme dioxygenase N-terminal domain-containing protein n=1 Tax=Artemisia annua TaxID=35608 RepID=A0A2U1LXD3_ARTAN|nr:hypothetical protein CTI12_AA214440 [Artemisia annua]